LGEKAKPPKLLESSMVMFTGSENKPVQRSKSKMSRSAVL